MKLYEETTLADFLYEMFVNFGQHAVLNFVRDRQSNGQLPEIKWDNCQACEEYSPVEDNACLVCGSNL